MDSGSMSILPTLSCVFTIPICLLLKICGIFYLLIIIMIVFPYILSIIIILYSLFNSALLQDVGSNSILQKHRAVQVTNRRQNYPWMSHGELCLPSSINNSVDLPLDEGFELMKNVNFFGTGLIDTIKTKVAGAGFNVDSLNGYEKYAKVLGEPDFPVYELGRWMSDVDFGRQILNGVNPVVIRKCESLPEKFPVTTEMVQSSLHRGLTLAQEMEVTIFAPCTL